MPTLINANFEERIVIYPTDYQWIESSIRTIKSVLLERIGAEVTRTTSIIRYSPNTTFPSHTYITGVEFLVLDGVFSYEHQIYPKGSYVRIPVGTSHTPKIGSEGATLWVKQQQFDRDDTEHKMVNTQNHPWLQGLVDGLTVMPLHEFKGEHIALVKWAPHTQFQTHYHWGGEEILVLEGTFYDEHGCYPEGTWLRNPHMSQHTPFTKEEGAMIYVKVGHLCT